MDPRLVPVTSGLGYRPLAFALDPRSNYGHTVKTPRLENRGDEAAPQLRPKFGSQHPQQVAHNQENSSCRDSKHPLLASMFTKTHIHTCVNKVFLNCTWTPQYPRTWPQPRLLLPVSSYLYLTAYFLDGAVPQAWHTPTSRLHADHSLCLDALPQTSVHTPFLLLSSMCYQGFSYPTSPL